MRKGKNLYTWKGFREVPRVLKEFKVNRFFLCTNLLELVGLEVTLVATIIHRKNL